MMIHNHDKARKESDNESRSSRRQHLNPPPFKVLLCGHGSTCPQASIQTDQFRVLLSQYLAPLPVHRAYLEFCRPTIHEALDDMHRQSPVTMIAAPLMLFAGRHVTHDIPDILRIFRNNESSTRIIMTSDIGDQPAIIQAATERIGQAVRIDNAASSPNITESLLLMVGRGHRDPAINRKVENLGKHLAHHIGMTASHTCFAGTIHPDITEGLRMVEDEGWKNVIVFPYLLFDGVLARRVADGTRNFAKTSAMNISLAPYIGVHPMAVEAMGQVIRKTIANISAGSNISI